MKVDLAVIAKIAVQVNLHLFDIFGWTMSNFVGNFADDGPVPWCRVIFIMSFLRLNLRANAERRKASWICYPRPFVRAVQEITIWRFAEHSILVNQSES